MTASPVDQPPVIRQEKLPAVETIDEVAPGVLRLQLPIALPGLAHVNCYAIEDREGFTLVDPGLPGKPSWLALSDRLKRAGIALTHVHSVVVTHSHPDHFGNAGRVAEEAGAQVITHCAFQLMYEPFHVCHLPDCDDILHSHADVGQEALPAADELQRFGMKNPWSGFVWDPSDNEPTLRQHGTAFLAENGWPYLQPGRRMRHGDPIKVGNRDWFAVHTPGHTLDHLCLYDPETGTLLSGDHILPTITPHISGIATGRDALGSFFDSLDRCAALPGISTALPAHGGVISNVGERVHEIKEHHAERLRVLARVSQAVGETDVTEYSHYLFRQERWGSMAESETYAHLQHLVASGHAVRRNDDNGVARYTVSDLGTDEIKAN